MTISDDRVLVADALRRLYADAELPPPSDHGPFAAVPLDTLIASCLPNLAHDEVPGLNRAAAFGVLAGYGVVRPELRDDVEPLAGFLFANASRGYILVRRDDPLTRRRFSAAHELGHYLLHFLPLLEQNGATEALMVKADGADAVREEGKAPKADDPTLPEMERQANRFAAELLMPEAVCRRLYAAYAGRYGQAQRFIEHELATDLLVSREAAHWRLHGLGLVN